MKIKEGFMLRQFGEDYIVVAVGDGAEDFNKLITLNSVGQFIYSELGADKTRDELIDAVMNKYEVKRAVAEADLEVFLGNLKKAGLLDE